MGGARAGGGGVSGEEGGGIFFEGLYHEPSLGHLVGLVRYYVHRMEVVSKEEVREVLHGKVFVLTPPLCFSFSRQGCASSGM